MCRRQSHPLFLAELKLLDQGLLQSTFVLPFIYRDCTCYWTQFFLLSSSYCSCYFSGSWCCCRCVFVWVCACQSVCRRVHVQCACVNVREYHHSVKVHVRERERARESVCVVCVADKFQERQYCAGSSAYACHCVWLGSVVCLYVPSESVCVHVYNRKPRIQIYMDFSIDPQARVLNYCFKS